MDESRSLVDAGVGDHVRVSRVSHGIGCDDASMLAYLGERGIVPGEGLVVKENRTLDGVVTVEDEDGIFHALGAPLARSIFVQEKPAARKN